METVTNHQHVRSTIRIRQQTPQNHSSIIVLLELKRKGEEKNVQGVVMDETAVDARAMDFGKKQIPSDQ